MTLSITEEERCLLLTLLNAERKNNLNSRKQTKDPNKDHIYLHKATVIDVLIARIGS